MEFETNDYIALGEAIQAGRIAGGWVKRAAFAREIGINDSTMAQAEGARPGRPSAAMYALITTKLGWPHNTWRWVLESGQPPDVLFDPDPAFSAYRRRSGNVGPRTDSESDDGGWLRRDRKPEGVSDEEWQRISDRTEAYIRGQIDSAAQER